MTTLVSLASPAAAVAVATTLLGILALLLLRHRDQRRAARQLEGRLAARERELGRQQHFLEAILGNATDGIVATDLAGRIVHANPTAERLHGRPLMRQHLVDICRSMNVRHADSAEVLAVERLPQYRAIFAQDLIDADYSGGREASVQRWSVAGTERDVRVSSRLLRDPDGEQAGAVFTFTDVTRERTAQEALARSNSLLELLLDAVPAGIFAFDAEGRITLLNRGARDMLALQDATTPLAWPKSRRFISRDGRTPLGQTNHPVVRALAGFDQRGDTVLLVNGGSDAGQFVRINSARVSGGTKHDIHTVMVMVDVTLDEQRHQQIERATRLDALGQLTSGIAHDFNNLLSAMLGAIQLAMGEEDPEKRKRHHKIAIRSMHRGSELTRRLMSFAHAQPSQPVAVAVKPLLEDFLRLAERTIVASISLKLEIDDPSLHVYCDKGQIETAILNLVLNARDAILRAGEGDTITLRARAFEPPNSGLTNGRLTNGGPTHGGIDGAQTASGFSNGRISEYGEISVIDNGPGMKSEVRRRAVDPFFSTKQPEVGAGTGLGLSIVASFVQQSGGFMRIDSEPGKGTAVTLAIPQAMAWLTKPESEMRPALIDGAGQDILIVEDEDDLRDVTGELIQRLGFRPHAAASGPEAMAYLESGGHVDAMLTDIVMPGGMNGFELAECVRRRDPDLPLVYMSGYAGVAADHRGTVGAPLIRKPCTIEDLSSALMTVLRRH